MVILEVFLGRHKMKASTPGILYGFKAPVSMALTPFFDEMIPRFKFLHVVR